MRRASLTTALVLALAAGIASSGAVSAAGPLPHVTVIGDSVATGIVWNPKAMAILRADVDLDMQVAVCRRLVGESCPYEGGRAPTLVDLVKKRGSRLGPTVVVAMGYNDSEPTFAASVEQSVDALLAAGVQRILWTTLRAVRRPYVPMNAELWAAAAAHPELTIVDWNRYSRSHPDWFQTDGLHLRRMGGAALATLLDAALTRSRDMPAIAIELPSGGLRPLQVGQRYQQRFAAGGTPGAYAWAVVWGTPPTGLHLTMDGTIRGRPKQVGTYQFVLRAEDADGVAGLRRVTMIVAPARR